MEWSIRRVEQRYLSLHFKGQYIKTAFSPFFILATYAIVRLYIDFGAL